MACNAHCQDKTMQNFINYTDQLRLDLFTGHQHWPSPGLHNCHSPITDCWDTRQTKYLYSKLPIQLSGVC